MRAVASKQPARSRSRPYYRSCDMGGFISRFDQSMKETLKWDHRRMLWKGQNNHGSLRRICRAGEYEANSSLVFHFSLYSLRSARPQSLCLSFSAISPTFFPVINKLLIFQQSTEEHRLTKMSRNKFGFRYCLRVQLGHRFFRESSWISQQNLWRRTGYWMWLYQGRRQNWTLKRIRGP